MVRAELALECHLHLIERFDCLDVEVLEEVLHRRSVANRVLADGLVQAGLLLVDVEVAAQLRFLHVRGRLGLRVVRVVLRLGAVGEVGHVIIRFLDLDHADLILIARDEVDKRSAHHLVSELLLVPLGPTLLVGLLDVPDGLADRVVLLARVLEGVVVKLELHLSADLAQGVDDMLELLMLVLARALVILALRQVALRRGLVLGHVLAELATRGRNRVVTLAVGPRTGEPVVCEHANPLILGVVGLGRPDCALLEAQSREELRGRPALLGLLGLLLRLRGVTEGRLLPTVT